MYPSNFSWLVLHLMQCYCCLTLNIFLPLGIICKTLNVCIMELKYKGISLSGPVHTVHTVHTIHMIEVIVKLCQGRIVHSGVGSYYILSTLLRTVEQIERIMVFEVVLDGASDVCDAPKCDELTTKAMDNHPIIL